MEGEEDVIAGAGGEEVDEAAVEEPVGVAAEFTVETPLTDSAGLLEADALELLVELDDDAGLEGGDEDDVSPAVGFELEAGAEDGTPCEELVVGGGLADAVVEDAFVFEEFVLEEPVSPPPWATPASNETLHFLISSTTCRPSRCPFETSVILHVSVTVPNDVSVWCTTVTVTG